MTPTLLLAAAGYTLTAQMVTVILAFFVVMWFLTTWTWKPILRLLDERRETVAAEFDSIERKQSELDSRLKDYEERLRQIDNEARERMNKAIDEGKRAAAALVEEARRTSEEMKTKAAADVRIEIEKARVELRDQMVRLSIGAAEKLIRTELNDARQRELVGSFLAELESRKLS